MTGLLHRHSPLPAVPTPPALLALPRQAAPAAHLGAANAGAGPGSGRAVLYGCFSCPWCYLASQHTDQLTNAADRPHWRMIEPDLHMPVTGLRPHTGVQQKRQAELEQVRALLLPGEQLPDLAPSLLPHTGPAVAGYAEARGAGVADTVRRVLFDAYWQHGADIGNPEVLRRLLVEPILAGHSTSWPLRESGYAVTLAGGPITSQAYRAMRDWQADWHHSAGGVVPALVSGGSLVSGPDVVGALRAIVLAAPGATPASLVSPGTPAWVTAGEAESSFLSTGGPTFEGTGGLSAYGTIRPSVSEPGKPDGEVAT